MSKTTEVLVIPMTSERNQPVVQADRNVRGQFLVGHTGIGGRPRGARNKLGEAFLPDLHADWQKHGKDVIERVRRDDPSAYLRVMASVVRAASEPEAEDPIASMTIEELKTELLAGLVELVPRASSRTFAGTGIDPWHEGPVATTQPRKIHRNLAADVLWGPLATV